MIRNAIARFMYGRYGSDQLNIFLAVLYIVLYTMFLFTGWRILGPISCVLVCAALFRMLSRNHPRRRAENAKFLKLAGPFLGWCRLRRTMRRDKEHRYFKCPNCGQQLRVPRGKGTITVTCRSCGASFQEKS